MPGEDCNFAAPKSREMPDPLQTPIFPVPLHCHQGVRVFRPLPFLAATLFVLSVNLSLASFATNHYSRLLTTILGSLYTFYITSVPASM